jgi:hypothetical protein
MLPPVTQQAGCEPATQNVPDPYVDSQSPSFSHSPHALPGGMNCPHRVSPPMDWKQKQSTRALQLMSGFPGVVRQVSAPS